MPDQANSLAFVYLKDENVLPNIDVWRSEFAKTANGSYGIRGIEITLTGKVSKKPASAGKEELLILTDRQLTVQLSPFVEKRQIRWDMEKRASKPVSRDELGAYAALGGAIHGDKTDIEVTGRLNKLNSKNFSLDVREWKSLDGTVTS